MLPRTAFCLFCDDVRQEVNSKTSYMGVYPVALAFPPNPPPDVQLLLPKLVVAVWFVTDANDKLERATINVSIPPGQTEIYRFDVPPEQLTPPPVTEDWIRRHSLNIVLPIMNLVLPHEGFIEVNVETEQGKISAGRLKVVVPGRPDPTTLTESFTSSSEQSPSNTTSSKSRTSRRRSATRGS